MALCEFEANLVYNASSRTVLGTARNVVSKEKKKKQNEREKKHSQQKDGDRVVNKNIQGLRYTRCGCERSTEPYFSLEASEIILLKSYLKAVPPPTSLGSLRG